MPQTARPSPPVAFINARLVDPATNLDQKGALIVEGGLIREIGPRLFNDSPPFGIDVIDCGGAVLAPGLVDMRVQLGEPGNEHKETIQTASEAASAGGVTAMVCLPNTDPVIDDVAGKTLVAASSLEKDIRGSGQEVAKKVGQALAERAKKAGVKSVVFDRGGFRYHGVIASLAEGAREGGLEF